MLAMLAVQQDDGVATIAARLKTGTDALAALLAGVTPVKSEAISMTKGISHLSDTIANSPGRRALVLALLAVFSALLSTYALSFWGVNGAPVLPGIYFGLVLGLGVFCWITRRKSDLFTVLAVTTIAWFLAYQTARHVYEFIGRAANYPKLSRHPRFAAARPKVGVCPFPLS
jgi:hypothetical protein